MARPGEHSKKAKQVLIPILGVALMAYFAFHAVQGDRGLLAWWQLRYQMDAANADLEILRGKRADLEHKIALLSPESLNLDMLDERTRALFAYARPDELIVIPPQQ